GFEIVLACDLITASRTAKFGLPEPKRGLVAGAGGLVRLHRRIPYHEAMRLGLTGALLDAIDAHRYGLVSALTEPGGALAAAWALAAEIAANGPLAVLATKKIIVESADWTNEDWAARQAAIFEPVVRSKDAIEGSRAFAEKRPPVWRGE
ncbi:MAG: enoyl-CoA hydratase, partial [Frankia sp.]|nr:enoyl-CoA hydratase [Frankia sp.]